MGIYSIKENLWAEFAEKKTKKAKVKWLTELKEFRTSHPQEFRGNKFGADEESTESYDVQNQNTENELAGSVNKNNSGSNGKIPEDIPFDDNDDVLAQQIKNAALKESDPEKQKKIWNEYRKYKNLPLEDWVFIKFMI